jgi:Flp pilus assembly protein TadG
MGVERPRLAMLADMVRRWLQGVAGQSFIEVALTLPILSFTLLGGAEMARAFGAQIAVGNAARVAAEAEALAAVPSSTEATSRAQSELSQTPGVASTNATVTFSEVTSAGASCTTSTSTTACYAKVRVQYTYSTLIAWPGIPHTFALDRTAWYRRYL